MDNRSEIRASISAFDQQFIDPSSEVKASLIFAFDGEAGYSVYVTTVVRPSCSCTVHPVASGSEVFDDFSFKATPFFFLWIGHFCDGTNLLHLDPARYQCFQP